VKTAFLPFVLLLLAQTAFAQTECQYKVNMTNYSEVQKLYEKGTDSYITDALTVRNITEEDRWGSLEVYNPYGVPISLALSFDYGYSVFAGPRQTQTFTKDMTIQPGESEKIQIGPNQTIWARFSFSTDSIRQVFKDNDRTYQKRVTVSKTYEECKKCAGKQCLDDGIYCTANSECGGGYCVENRCNSERLCYLLNCNCDADEVQCPGNNACVPKNTLGIGAVPLCSSYECTTNYTNSSTGECAIKPKSEEEVREMLEQTASVKTQVLMLLPVMVGVGLIIFFMKLEYDRRKLESELEKKGKKQ
jgi:hypothetical protein